MLPKRREKGLLIEELPAETLVYDTTNHKVRCLNPVARLVWSHCNGRTTEAKMVDILRKDLSIPADEAVVQITLEKLAQAGLLETEEHTWIANPTSRRQAAKTLATFGIAAAAALVATIVAPTPAMAASVGVSCTSPGPCPGAGTSCCRPPSNPPGVGCTCQPVAGPCAPGTTNC